MLNNPPQKYFRNMAYLSDEDVPFFHKLFNVIWFSYENGKIWNTAGCDKGMEFLHLETER